MNYILSDLQKALGVLMKIEMISWKGKLVILDRRTWLSLIVGEPHFKPWMDS